MISNPNTTSVVANWESVAHSDMQAAAEKISHSQHFGNNDGDFSPVITSRHHDSDAPRFFAWSQVAEGREVEKRVLTFDHNVHSEYRDCYVEKHPTQQVLIMIL